MKLGTRSGSAVQQLRCSVRITDTTVPDPLPFASFSLPIRKLLIVNRHKVLAMLKDTGHSVGIKPREGNGSNGFLYDYIELVVDL